LSNGESRHYAPQIAARIQGRAVVFGRTDVAAIVGPVMLGRLDRFGLAITGKPLLEPKPEEI